MYNLRHSAFRRRASSASGFTQIELLVSVVLITIAAGGAALVVANSSNSLQRSRRSDRMEALVDDDAARMRELATRLTCCSGTCNTTPAGASCFGGATPGDDRYYYPVVTSAASPTGAEFLENPTAGTPAGLCNTGGIGQAMIDTMALPVNNPDAEFTAAGLGRAAARANTSDGRNHLVRVTYAGPAGSDVNRVVYLLPPAASWCP